MRGKLALTLLFAIAAPSIPMSAQAAQQVPERTVERIQREVRHELLMLPYYNIFDIISYRVDGTVVTLMGYVTQPVLKKDAENVVKRIEGVEKVVNQIEVLPTSSMDDQLRLRLYGAIYRYPALERYALPVIKPIRIIVKNGNVILEGVVDSEADKNLVGLRANGVSGIFSVTNNLAAVKSK